MALLPLARSVAMSPHLHDRARQDIIDALLRLAMFEAAKRRHQSGEMLTDQVSAPFHWGTRADGERYGAGR